MQQVVPDPRRRDVAWWGVLSLLTFAATIVLVFATMIWHQVAPWILAAFGIHVLAHNEWTRVRLSHLEFQMMLDHRPVDEDRPVLIHLDIDPETTGEGVKR